MISFFTPTQKSHKMYYHSSVLRAPPTSVYAWQCLLSPKACVHRRINEQDHLLRIRRAVFLHDGMLELHSAARHEHRRRSHRVGRAPYRRAADIDCQEHSHATPHDDLCPSYPTCPPPLSGHCGGCYGKHGESSCHGCHRPASGVGWPHRTTRVCCFAVTRSDSCTHGWCVYCGSTPPPN